VRGGKDVVESGWSVIRKGRVRWEMHGVMGEEEGEVGDAWCDGRRGG
jgi:hypothetical protein